MSPPARSPEEELGELQEEGASPLSFKSLCICLRRENGVRLFLEACDESAAATAPGRRLSQLFARSLSQFVVNLTEVVRAGRGHVYRLITHRFLSRQLEPVWLRYCENISDGSALANPAACWRPSIADQ